MSAFPDMGLRMDDVVLREGAAVYRWTFFGTNSGPRGSGRRVCFSGFEEWTFGGDGLIGESKGHFDEQNSAAAERRIQ
jgi:SnoaL-like polyketide cyclase